MTIEQGGTEKGLNFRVKEVVKVKIRAGWGLRRYPVGVRLPKRSERHLPLHRSH